MTFYCRYNFSTPPTDNTAIHYLSLGLSRLCVAGIGLLWAGRGGGGGIRFQWQQQQNVWNYFLILVICCAVGHAVQLSQARGQCLHLLVVSLP